MRRTHSVAVIESENRIVNYLRKNGTELHIDGDRIGLMAVSAHGAMALLFAEQPGRKYLRFAVFYYSIMPGPAWPDRAKFIEQEGSAVYISDLPEIEQLRTDLPVLIVRCGTDYPPLNASIDNFVQSAKAAGAPYTLIDYATGKHGFDVYQKDEAQARQIVEQTLDFMKTNFEKK